MIKLSCIYKYNKFLYVFLGFRISLFLILCSLFDLSISGLVQFGLFVLLMTRAEVGLRFTGKSTII